MKTDETTHIDIRARNIEFAYQTIKDIQRGATPKYPLKVYGDDESLAPSVFLDEYIKPTNDRRPLTLEEYVKAMDTGKISITDEDTVVAAMRLSKEEGYGERVAILNMASSSRPGGGFLSGASAQEESLCRRSTLIASIEGFADLYAKPYWFPTHWGLPTYDGEPKCGGGKAFRPHAIFSPHVQFFKTPEDEGFDYLPEPFTCDVISSPAYRLSNSQPPSTPLQEFVRATAIASQMLPRIQLVFYTAIANRCKALVLGAWGCGAYGLDPYIVARLFKAYICYDSSIVGPESQLKSIIFAIKTTPDNQGTLKDNFMPFKEVFNDPGTIDFAALCKK